MEKSLDLEVVYNVLDNRFFISVEPWAPHNNVGMSENRPTHNRKTPPRKTAKTGVHCL
jgi:hypothetical protein